MPDLSNIRDYLGWVIGQKVVDVTSEDPADIPDAVDGETGITLHFDSGGELTFYSDELSFR